MGRAKGPALSSNEKALKQLTRDFAAVASGVKTNGPIIKLSQVGVFLIRKRTVEGAGTNGRLKVYADSYKKYRRRRGMQTSPTNYHHSGTMLRAVFFKVNSPQQSTLGVRPITATNSPTPRDEVAEHLQKRSEWFGFTDAEKKILDREAKAILTQILLDSITDSRPIGGEVSLLRKRVKVKRIKYPTPVNYLSRKAS